MDLGNVTWRKASYSGDNGGGCVEVATADALVAVRDSKDPNGPQLSFAPSAWQAFMTRTVLRAVPEQNAVSGVR